MQYRSRKQAQTIAPSRSARGQCPPYWLELLGNLKVTLESQDNIQPEDRDLIMQLSPLYLEKIQAAKQEGKQEDRQEIALRMLRKNMPLETIAELTELNTEQLQALQSQLENS